MAAAQRMRDVLFTWTEGRVTAERNEGCAAGDALGRRPCGTWVAASGLDLVLLTSDMFGRRGGGLSAGKWEEGRTHGRAAEHSVGADGDGNEVERGDSDDSLDRFL